MAPGVLHERQPVWKKSAQNHILFNNKESEDFENASIAILDLKNVYLDTKIVNVSVLEAKIWEIQ